MNELRIIDTIITDSKKFLRCLMIFFFINIGPSLASELSIQSNNDAKLYLGNKPNPQEVFNFSEIPVNDVKTT